MGPGAAAMVSVVLSARGLWRLTADYQSVNGLVAFALPPRLSRQQPKPLCAMTGDSHR